MIQHTIPPHAPLALHTCGSVPHLVEARGRSGTDPRLLGTRARSYHVECSRCAVATAPQLSARTAEHLWHTASALIPVARLPALRLEAERALINAA